MLVDSHCHLDLDQFDSDRTRVVQSARDAGIGLIVNPGIDLADSRRALDLADEFPEVYAAVGIHPNSATSFGPESPGELRALAAHPKAVAVGEIGLDYYWDRTPVEQQQSALRAQLTLAAEVGLPVIVHSRDSNDDLAAILRSWVRSDEFRTSALARRPFAGVLHAFSGDLVLAEEAYDWGFVLSLGGPATFKNARELHDLIPQLRLDRLMLETDAPYLTPHPHRGRRNEPAYVALVRDRIAELCDVSPQQVSDTSSALALCFFGLENVFRAQDPANLKPTHA